ncbi:WD40 repeat domain-containing protein [Streptomyces sp. SL13]|uniref:WD40 repeat domain-containing protein n=1 Tax=Streptantibioticus silvisoli TaxID=2705255 RepID=A0AA90H5P0_9ACTN|nr:WD40 repeat domain-containing protein [Streptantibioticus silvisoli]MDI5968572.1 WD40 repeat domain-containing protein [Streptantibioticus silvisoli]
MPGVERKPRRFLIATAVAHYRSAPAWDRPGLIEARREIIDLFTGVFGYRHVDDPGLDPTQHHLTGRLRAFCTSPERRDDDLVAVYVAGHGEVLDEDQGGGHVLLTHDTDPGDLADALPTETLARKILSGTRVRRLLLMLDTCYSGQGGNELTAAALERMSRRWGAAPGAGLVVLSSAQALEQAVTGAFPALLRRAVDDEALAGRHPVALALDSVVRRMNETAGPQRVGLTQAGLTGEVPAFLPNPRHDPRATGVRLGLPQDRARQAQADRRAVEFGTRLLVGAQGSHGTAEESGWWFAGRRTALTDVTRWLAEDGGPPSIPVLAVTAGPGSGKTAVLGIVAALAHPQLGSSVPGPSLHLPDGLREAARRVDVAVHAQNLTDHQVLEALAAAARVEAATTADLLAAVRSRPHPVTVLVDGVDEAATPETLCDDVLRPVAEHGEGRIRLLLGTRPHLLRRLGLARERQVDLDADRYTDPAAVLAYTLHNLLSAHPGSPYRSCPEHVVQAVAGAVADAAGRSFLIARLVAGTLAARPSVPDPADPAWRAGLPRHAEHAMADDLALRLGAEVGRATDLLRPLAYAQGQGLPWEDLWTAVASGISGQQYTDADIARLRERAGSYVVESVEDDRSTYRLFHRALAELLTRDCDDTAAHAAFARALAGRVPAAAGGGRDWRRAHPYTLRHLAAHAAAGGVLDDVLADPEYLVHADPDSLTPHLHTARVQTSRLCTAVYRCSIGTHRTATAADRRGILALDAARYNGDALRDALTGRSPAGCWIPLRATGSTVSPAALDTLAGHADAITAVACCTVEGCTVAVTASPDRTARVWDLRSGRPRGRPLAGHDGAVRAVACTELDGRPVAVTGSADHTVRLWDLTTGQPYGQPLTGHTDTVCAAACTTVRDRPVAVTGSADHTVRLWDLTGGRPHGQPFTGHDGPVWAVACTELDGRQMAVTGSADGTVRLWDLTTGQLCGRPLTGHTRAVYAVACTVLNGRPVAVSGSADHTVRLWDLTTGQPYGQPLTGHTHAVHAVACTVLEGRPVAVTGPEDGTARVWDLATGRPHGRPLAGHTATVRAVACTTVRGRPVAVTGSADRTLRTWDLAAAQPPGHPLTGHTDTVCAVACTTVHGRPVAVTASADRSVRVWDLDRGRPHDRPLTGHEEPVHAVACGLLDGRPVAVTGSADHTVRLWDLAGGLALGRPMTGHRGPVWAVACTVLYGRAVAVTGSADHTVRMWDLATGQPHGRPLTGHTQWVRAVACTTLDGRPVAVTGSADRTVRLWDLTTGQPHGQPLTGHTRAVHAVACTVLSGRPVAVTGSADRTVRLWDLTTGQPHGRPLSGHTDTVSAVACATAGTRTLVVTGSADHTVRVWDPAAPADAAVVRLPAPCGAVAVPGPDRIICSFSDDIALFGQRTGS